LSSTPPLDEKIPTNVIIDAYKQMLTSLFLGTLISLILGFLLFLPFLWGYFFSGNTGTRDPPLLATVMLAGALGAFFSALTRLYSFNELPKVLIDSNFTLPTVQLLMYSLIPPVVGAIAALVLYLAFAGNLVSGDLFPHFTCSDPAAHVECHTFGSLLSSDQPILATDFAKVIVWSFIAGFAERLVPNTLDALSKAVAKTS
jgi:hypothetical protein